MTILITDDFYTNRLQIKLVLQSMGHKTEEASNGSEAIEKFKKSNYDLLLMDIEMPVRNGIETTRYIRKHLKEPKNSVPIIAITAHYIDSDLKIKEMGFDGFIGKPFTREKFERCLSLLKIGQ